MASYCFVLVSLAVVLQVLVASASTQYIDAICQKVITGKAFCTKTLSGYPAASSATSTFQAAQAVLGLGISYAGKSASVSAKAAVENPNLKKHFEGCQDAFSRIITNLKSASIDLKESAMTANYAAMICYDQTKMVKILVGKFSDKASKNVMMMRQMMEKLVDIAVGATVAVGG